MAPGEVPRERVGDEQLAADEEVHEELQHRARHAVQEVGGDGRVAQEERDGVQQHDGPHEPPRRRLPRVQHPRHGRRPQRVAHEARAAPASTYDAIATTAAAVGTTISASAFAPASASGSAAVSMSTSAATFAGRHCCGGGGGGGG